MINITNYDDHPTRRGYKVFKFFEEERSDYFESLLNEREIWYEKHIEEEEDRNIYFYAVRNDSFDVVSKLNFAVNGKFRKSFIPNAYFRWTVIILSIIVMTIALIGYFKAH